MEPRLVSRVNLECHVAAKDATRFQLHALYFTPEGVISTDGKLLLITPYPDDSLEEYPAVFEDKLDPSYTSPEDAHSLHLEARSNPERRERRFSARRRLA